MSETELALHIGLDDMLKRAAKIQPTTATTGNGLDTGFDWYSNMISISLSFYRLVDAIKGNVKVRQ